MASTTKSKLNPQVRDVEIGIRTLRKIKIYPLSVGDQLALSDLIVEALNKYNDIVGDEKKTDMQVFSEVANFAIDMIKENLDTLIDKIADRLEAEQDDVSLIDDITNEQAFQIGKIVYEVNFETILKNVKSLFGEMPENLTEQPLKRQSQPSAKSTEATKSKTSTAKSTKKAG
jgi:hypothetical protein